MINLSLNRKDFLYAVEGFASGSHLRQHVWQEIVYKSIPQMSDDDMDYFWFYMRRTLATRTSCTRSLLCTEETATR